MQETQIQSLGWEAHLRRQWQPIPVFLPGEFHRQRNLASYNPQGGKESDMTEWLSLHTSRGALDWEQDKLLDRHLLDIVVYWSDHSILILVFLSVTWLSEKNWICPATRLVPTILCLTMLLHLLTSVFSSFTTLRLPPLSLFCVFPSFSTKPLSQLLGFFSIFS